MGENTLEEKLKLENEITILRRELKNILSQTTGAKNEYNSIVSLIDNNKKQLEEQKEYLLVVQNDISKAKLDWVQEKNKELKDLEEKNSQANNILKRKAELNKQEEDIRKIEASDIEVRNETRRLELKLEQDKLDLENIKKEITKEKKEIEKEKVKLSKDKIDFKKKVAEVFSEVEKI